MLFDNKRMNIELAVKRYNLFITRFLLLDAK